MTLSVSERQEKYESDYNQTILYRLPVVVRATIRNYKKLTQRLDSLYDERFYEVLSQAMLFTITNIPDAIFGYCHNDEITFILKNDQDHLPWYNNDIQKINSTISSLVTLGFQKSVELFGDNIDLVGEAIFSVIVYGQPSIVEAFNNLLWRQSICMKNAINIASFLELSDKFGPGTAKSLLKDTDFKEKTELLLQHCGKDIHEDYPIPFLRGIGVYKIPALVNTRNGTAKRNRWHVDKDLPNFIEDSEFIINILNNGSDIYRRPDILSKD